MPRNRDYDDFDEDDEDDEPRQPLEGDKLIRHLRRQVKERDKRLTDVEKRLSEYEKRDRRESVESVLKGAKVNEKYARWVVRDLDDQEPTKENVLKWLEDNADLVGLERQPDTTVDDETRQSLQRIQNAERGTATDTSADPIAAKLSDPSLTPEALAELIGKSLEG